MNKIVTPIAIVIAGVLIAGAVYFSGTGPAATGQSAKDIVNSALEPQKPDVTVEPVRPTDHIRGSKDAKITIVEYSDTECPFCKRFHSSLKEIMAEHEASGKVAWVYRHFPLDMHKKAPKEAEATECAAEVGGPDAFWKYIDMVFEETQGNDSLDLALLPVFAERLNLDKTAFNTCLDSGKYATKIQEEKAKGFAAGARGTPHTVLFVNTGGKIETIPLVDAEGNGLGALPTTALKSIVDRLLSS